MPLHTATAVRRPGRALRPHQREGVDKTVKTLVDHDRATVVMACGAGKTAVGAEVAAECLPEHGRVLLAVPNLDLVRQGLGEHRHGSRPLGQVIAVCSDERAVEQVSAGVAAFDAEVTTDPRLLAMLLRRPGPATVACTYQSLQVIRDAHALHGVEPWHLAIGDEAHRLAGARGKKWAAFHDNQAVAAERRVYMTATPRLYDAEDDQIIGMDDQRVFGPVAYWLPFGKAIDLGLLADYRVVVSVITNEEILGLLRAPDGRPFLQSGRRAVDPEVLAAQVALLRVVHEYGSRRMITYHGRVADARYFAHTLPDALDLLEPDQRPADLASLHINGTMDADARREILSRLGARDAGVRIVTNCQVLGEGIDVPAVNGVGLLSARDSHEATVQAVGRAMRLVGDQPGKVATIWIPLVLGPGEDPRSALAGSRFAPVWHAIAALRAHDERLADYLDKARFELGRGAEGPGQGKWAVPDWLRLSGAQVPEDFARAITLRMVRATSPSWEEWYGRASAQFAEDGYLHVPKSDGEYWQWLNYQRVLERKGKLPAERKARLDKIGMPWSSDPVERWIAAVAEHYETHGNLRVTKDTKWGKLGAANVLVRLRAAKRADQLTAEQTARAEAAGMVWAPEDQARRQRFEKGYPAALSFHRAHGTLDPSRGQIWQGVDLHQWLYQIKRDREDDLLSSLTAAARVTAGLKPARPARVRVGPDMLAQLGALGVQFAPATPADEVLATFLCAMAAIRERSGRTGEDLARSFGLSRSGELISRWERGLFVPSMEHAEAWARELGHDLLILEQDGTRFARWTAADARMIWGALRARREARGIDRAALAGRLGYSEKTLMRVEGCGSGHTLRTLLGVLLALDCRMVPSPRTQAPTLEMTNR